MTPAGPVWYQCSPLVALLLRLAHRLGQAVKENRQQYQPKPPTVAKPISRRPIPRSTIIPNPPTEIIDAITTIDSDNINA